MTTVKTREQTLGAAVAERGWTLQKVGRRHRLVVADTGTVVADDWSTNGGLTLDELEDVLAGSTD